ncbi:AraC family transcriptional regulator [Rhodococcus koreensis]
MNALMPYAGCERHPDRREIFGDASVGVVAQTISMPSTMAGHRHEFAGLVFVRSGTGVYECETGAHRVSAGSAMIFVPGGWHGYRAGKHLRVTNVVLDSRIFDHELVWLRHDTAWRILTSGADSGDRPTSQRVVTVPAERWPRVEYELGDLERTEPGGPGERARRLGMLLSLVGELSTVLRPPRTDSDQVTRVAALLADSLKHDWTLGELADAAGFSSAHLARLFTVQVGAPPMAYLNRLRAERAAQMLIDTDLSISAIARAVGWTDPNYASRRFRVAYGVTPTAYRAGARADDQTSLH